jgi:UDP-N-acetylglucosamine 4,6-dehydratase
MASVADLTDKTILLTGGTGSFGQAFIERALQEDVKAVRVYSRDELKQHELRQRIDDKRVRFLLGDVRDLDRLTHATRGCDIIIHAAALKQVPICEYNPFEAVQTNIIGAQNVVSAAIASNVPKTIALSSDKAVNPVNLYGATKLAAEKIVTQANAYAADSPARFSSVRYGNVLASRGSVIPLFKYQAKEYGEITITDPDMTRFFMPQSQTVQFVLDSLERMQGGEIFVPKMPARKIVDLAEEIAPGVPQKIIGIRPGEKVHETLITSDESRHARGFEDYYAIYPSFTFWGVDYPEGEELPPGFKYTSHRNAIDTVRPTFAGSGG